MAKDARLRHAEAVDDGDDRHEHQSPKQEEDGADEQPILPLGPVRVCACVNGQGGLKPQADIKTQ